MFSVKHNLCAVCMCSFCPNKHRFDSAQAWWPRRGRWPPRCVLWNHLHVVVPKENLPGKLVPPANHKDSFFACHSVHSASLLDPNVKFSGFSTMQGRVLPWPEKQQMDKKRQDKSLKVQKEGNIYLPDTISLSIAMQNTFETHDLLHTCL